MKEFHFTKTYFNKTIFEDIESGVRVVVDEKPSFNLSEEEYSLRVSTRFEETKTVHRNYAIEHHMPPVKHSFPHLQFKFHTEEIGQFRIRIDLKDDEEYKMAVLGFIYKIKDVLTEMERFKKGLTEEILIIKLVSQLKEEGNFLMQKMGEGISKYRIEFDDKGKREKLEKLKQNNLLLDFIGSDNMDKIEKEYLKK